MVSVALFEQFMKFFRPIALAPTATAVVPAYFKNRRRFTLVAYPCLDPRFLIRTMTEIATSVTTPIAATAYVTFEPVVDTG